MMGKSVWALVVVAAVVACQVDAWMWMGALTSASIKFKCSCTNAQSVSLAAKVSNKAEASWLNARVLGESLGVCELQLENLLSNAKYEYVLKNGDCDPVNGFFTTAGQSRAPSEYNFAFSSNVDTASSNFLFRIFSSL